VSQDDATSPEAITTPPAAQAQDSQAILAPNYQLSNSGNKKGGKGYRRQLDANGQPKKNFYNPPGKVMRHLAQQSYFDNFYGNQGQFYTLKQKYKTQMCKHFLANNDCPLAQFCQFAHGPTELRQSNDPLPQNFGKTALGAVHSNYKTVPCKQWFESGECKFGDGCSFYHNDHEKRRLIDPLPNLPEGVTLPPMPEKLKNFKEKKGNYKPNSDSMNPMHFSPHQQPMPMIQISSLTDIMALGGFNPNKYLSPQPMPFNTHGNQFMNMSAPHMGQSMPQQYGNPAPFGGQKKGNKDKKGKKNEDKGKTQEKKYQTKQP